MAHNENEGKSQDEVANATNSDPSCGKLVAISRCRINELLPNELLAYIFAIAIIDFLPKDSRHLLALVCSICRRWRDVAIEASNLWTTIYIHDEKHIPAAEFFLERSKTQLLDVDVVLERLDHFDCPSEEDASRNSRLRAAELTSAHLERTRTLSLSIDDVREAEHFSTLYRPMSAPHLISLSVDIPGWSQGIAPFLESICSLSSNGSDRIHLNGTSISSLTRLELTSVQLEHEELRIVFTYFPSLETLILPRFDRKWGLEEDQEDPPIISAPSSLRSLAVHLDSMHVYAYAENSSHCSCVLGSVRFQNLEYLEVLGETSSDNLKLGIHFKDLPKLKTLRLQRCSVPPLDDDFFRSLKLLNHLELVDNLSHVKWLTESSPTRAILPFPHLSSISLSDKSRKSHDMSQWARLAQLAVQNSGCTQFSVKVTAHHHHSMTCALGPQDEHIRVEIEDYHPKLHRLLPPEDIVHWSDDDDDYDSYWDYPDHASDFDGYVYSD
ncbi:hypothetical protein EDD18DRAFT_1455713 [Armillaria luteobubalina]|uniref:F-box domain-containing protein n=1 Tax=Armillaria luteobubalina TaxID=153913 RepID=A0AA39V5E0_9AGAR|nr:hypothetical protein EDD18DRAFT_1455713 [Armillaria luteobubalina]